MDRQKLLLKIVKLLLHNDDKNIKINVNIVKTDEDIYGKAIWNKGEKFININANKSFSKNTDIVILAHELAHIQTMIFDDNDENFKLKFKFNIDFLKELFPSIDFESIILYKE